MTLYSKPCGTNVKKEVKRGTSRTISRHCRNFASWHWISVCKQILWCSTWLVIVNCCIRCNTVLYLLLFNKASAHIWNMRSCTHYRNYSDTIMHQPTVSHTVTHWQTYSYTVIYRKAYNDMVTHWQDPHQHNHLSTDLQWFRNKRPSTSSLHPSNM